MTCFEWRYIEFGHVKHALRRSSDRAALCGTGPHWCAPDWYGTGSQAEYERVAELPECRRCLRFGARVADS